MAIKYAILGLLHYRDMHGYQIKQHIEKNFGHMWSVNFGQIYPNLKAILEDGLAEVRADEKSGEKGPPRKLYSLTEKGRREFASWLAGDPERPMLLRDPFLMRFVFFGFGDHGRALEMVEGQIADYEKQLRRRRDNQQRWQKRDRYVRLMGRLGLELNEMYLDWLKMAREEIAAELDDEATFQTAVAAD